MSDIVPNLFTNFSYYLLKYSKGQPDKIALMIFLMNNT
jgi:hypothetical protein